MSELTGKIGNLKDSAGRGSKPDWWPNNPWVAGNHVVRTETWEQAADAMAKAMISRIEHMAYDYRRSEQDGVLAVLERLRRECERASRRGAL